MSCGPPRLRLRRSEPRDAEQISAYRSDPEVHAHQGWDRTDPDHVRTEIEEMLARAPGEAGGWVQFTVETLEDDRLVGDVGIRVDTDEPGVVLVGYTMGPRPRTTDTRPRPSGALVDYAFDTLGRRARPRLRRSEQHRLGPRRARRWDSLSCSDSTNARTRNLARRADGAPP